MGRQIDYELARSILVEEFRQAEEDFQRGKALKIPQTLEAAANKLFSSSTQAFREALIGCALLRNWCIDLFSCVAIMGCHWLSRRLTSDITYY